MSELAALLTGSGLWFQWPGSNPSTLPQVPSSAVQSVLELAHTNGFKRQGDLDRHFSLHGVEFAATSPDEYEAMADSFIGGPKAEGVMECSRKSGQLVRFNPRSQEYGVLSPEGNILTYFKPRPCATIPHWQPKVNCHGERDNTAYFQRECAR